MRNRELESIMGLIFNDETPACVMRRDTAEDALCHAEWAAKLKPGDVVEVIERGVFVVSPEGIEGNRIHLLGAKEMPDKTYCVGSILAPISAILPKGRF